jgi:dTDP-4-amino-4,6-dideoxygalactose transaminase
VLRILLGDKGFAPKKQKDFMEKFLPFALPEIGEEEIESVCETLRSGWLTTGPKVKRFEKEFADFVGAKHALAVNSATSGLHLSLDAIGIQPGDKVITSIYTFTATAEVIRYMGADPVFVDIDPRTLNIDTSHVTEIVNADPAVKAIMPVHLGGLACDMDSVTALAEARSLAVVEDAAHALPAAHRGQRIGSIGDLTAFSFYVTKPLATGEGGMVVTDRSDYAERIKTMRLHGINRDVFDRYTSDKPSWYYEVVAPGFKYNMSDVAAAIGIHQLQKANQFRKRREQIATEYSNAFEELPLELPANGEQGDLHAWHLYVIRLRPEHLRISRNQFIEQMLALGIGVSVHYIPLHLQPYWRDKYSLKEHDFPVAQDSYERAISLPIYTKMADSDVSRVIEAVCQVITENAR